MSKNKLNIINGDGSSVTVSTVSELEAVVEKTRSCHNTRGLILKGHLNDCDFDDRFCLASLIEVVRILKLRAAYNLLK